MAARLTVPFALAMVAAGCATQGSPAIAQISAGAFDLHTVNPVGVEACRAALGTTAPSDGPALDAGRIRVANWNVKKKSRPSWQTDFKEIVAGSDLLLLQEASLREDTINDIDATRHWSFAPGYRAGRQISGVLTLSTAAPVTRCSLVAIEPVLRTPKATSVTRYRLSSGSESLVVINVHAVNFSFGLGAFRDQFEQIRSVLDLHDGPVILSGDFNTWRQARLDIVDTLATDLGLEAVSFEHDHRVSRFGQRLDHLFVRGLDIVSAETMPVTTSDHNPMSATLRL
jgi:endonuclease/exonuclease/phosphatase (EEP) superfamily protein YafD